MGNTASLSLVGGALLMSVFVIVLQMFDEQSLSNAFCL
jgi:hypothetical protein